jgi:hypothetical protein
MLALCSYNGCRYCLSPRTRSICGKAPLLVSQHPQTARHLLFLPRLRPPERHPAGSDACIEDQPGHQPGGPYAACTGAGAPHAAQYLDLRCCPVRRRSQAQPRQRCTRRCTGRKTIDGQIEARQLVQRTGEDGGALASMRAASPPGVAGTGIIYDSEPDKPEVIRLHSRH